MFGFGKKRPDDGTSLTQPLPSGWNVVDLGLLGAGGMARVYRVRDEVLGREVALKVLRPELMSQERAVTAFVEEARVTAQLDHPNIPAVYALANERKRSSAFTMKVLEGQTLQQLLEENERENVDGLTAALEVLVRICDAVSFAHARGVLHLDLKPSNVMVGDYGQIYLVDWGIARRTAELPTEPVRSDTAQGTPAYMSPEQANGDLWKLDARTDVFALGGMLFRVLAGRPPYVGPTADAIVALAAAGVVRPPDAVSRRHGQPMPRRLVSICMKALAADPAGRYQSADAFKLDLERFLRGLGQLPQRTFKAGEEIIIEGTPGDAAYVIVDGACVATRLVGAQRQELRRLGPGEMFGEAAIFTGKPRSATVTAVTDTVVGVVDQQGIREEMERTSFMSLAIRTVASTFLDLDQQTVALTGAQQQGRVRELALRHVAFAGIEAADGSLRAPWPPLRARLREQTGSTEAELVDVLRNAEGLSVEGDVLVLRDTAG